MCSRNLDKSFSHVVNSVERSQYGTTLHLGLLCTKCPLGQVCGGLVMAPHVNKIVTVGWRPIIKSHYVRRHKQKIEIHLSLYNNSATLNSVPVVWSQWVISVVAGCFPASLIHPRTEFAKKLWEGQIFIVCDSMTSSC